MLECDSARLPERTSGSEVLRPDVRLLLVPWRQQRTSNQSAGCVRRIQLNWNQPACRGVRARSFCAGQPTIFSLVRVGVRCKRGPEQTPRGEAVGRTQRRHTFAYCLPSSPRTSRNKPSMPESVSEYSPSRVSFKDYYEGVHLFVVLQQQIRGCQTVWRGKTHPGHRVCTLPFRPHSSREWGQLYVLAVGIAAEGLRNRDRAGPAVTSHLPLSRFSAKQCERGKRSADRRKGKIKK